MKLVSILSLLLFVLVSLSGNGWAKDARTVALSDELKLSICEEIFYSYMDYDQAFSQKECLAAQFGTERASATTVLGSFVGKYNPAWTGDNIYACSYSLKKLTDIKYVNCARIYPEHKKTS